jgi:hypothetical protein
MKQYSHSQKISTQQKDLPLSEKFLARARAKKARGEPYDHWTRAAQILWRIENDLPVGRARREGRGAR